MKAGKICSSSWENNIFMVSSLIPPDFKGIYVGDFFKLYFVNNRFSWKMKVNFSFSFASLSLRFCKLYLENILMKHPLKKNMSTESSWIMNKMRKH